MSRKRKDSQFRCINKSNNTEKLPPAENFHHFLTWKIFDAKEHNLTIWANLSE